MPLPRIAQIIAVAAVIVGGASCQTPQVMGDPVFGMTYDIRKVHFDLAPTVVRTRCRGLPDKTLWLFAHWNEPDTEFFVLSGRKSEVSGIGVVIKAGTCIQALPDWVLTGDRKYWSGAGHPPPIPFTERVLHGLAADLLSRYARAFGGRNNFIEHVCADGLPMSELLPMVRQEFESFVGAGR